MLSSVFVLVVLARVGRFAAKISTAFSSLVCQLLYNITKGLNRPEDVSISHGRSLQRRVTISFQLFSTAVYHTSVSSSMSISPLSTLSKLIYLVWKTVVAIEFGS
jgi:hypothetical protein